jgi:hypothetical protein
MSTPETDNTTGVLWEYNKRLPSSRIRSKRATEKLFEINTELFFRGGCQSDRLSGGHTKIISGV